MTPSRGAQALGVGIALMGLVFTVTALRLPTNETYARVGPGAVPALVGIGLVVAGIAFARAAVRGGVEPPVPPVSRAPLVWIVGGFALATACLPRVGFPVAVALLFAVTARGFGSRRWLHGALIGLALGLVIYTLFAYALGVSLPAGMFLLEGVGDRAQRERGGLEVGDRAQRERGGLEVGDRAQRERGGLEGAPRPLQ